MKRLLCSILLALSCLSGARAAPPQVDPRLTDEHFLYEVLRYSYQWYLGDRFFMLTAEAKTFEIWIRPLKPKTPDEGDNSLHAEIWFPAAQLQFKLKLADYFIPELKRQVRSSGYHITQAALLPASPRPRGDYAVVTLDRVKARAYMFDSRNEPQAPDEALKNRLLTAMHDVAQKYPPPSLKKNQMFFLSDVSPVNGDLWVVWVNRKLAIRFAGELGAEQPDLLQYLPLHTQIYDLDRQVVASLLQIEGRTGYITKDWASRILFQCLVQGERVDMTPAELGLTPEPASP
ncbi:MAG TPA: hypothetical protein VFJ90_13945 [Candidatus Didemnitutus sp.]|nr:hypothetical protein [Candidatus Didemnitutus sp.]